MKLEGLARADQVGPWIFFFKGSRKPLESFMLGSDVI